jgi:hypothetical protein
MLIDAFLPKVEEWVDRSSGNVFGISYWDSKEQMDAYDAPRSLNPLGVFA